MNEREELLAKRIEKAPVISLIEPWYEGQTFPASANPLSDVEKALIVSLLRGVAQGWQDISTAPLDKTMVALLVAKGNYRRYGVGWYMPMTGWQGWHKDGDYVEPTHWSPLPDASSLTSTGGGTAA